MSLSSSPIAAFALNTAANLSEGAKRAAAEIGAVQVWALVHGLATLMLDGQLPADDAMIERVIASKF